VAIPLILKQRDWNESIVEANKYLAASGPFSPSLWKKGVLMPEV
jgi:hypothetical protein